MVNKPYKWTSPKRAELCKKLMSEIQDASVFTTIKLAIKVGMTRHSLQKLGTEYPDDIGQTLSSVREILEDRLLTGGLNRKLDANLTKFVLSANYNYVEKSETSSTIILQEATPVFGD